MKTENYLAWRATFQSDAQSALSAFNDVERLSKKLALEKRNKLKSSLEVAQNTADESKNDNWDSLAEFKRRLTREKFIEKHIIDGLMLMVNAGCDYQELVDHLTSEQARLTEK